jgi:hypothetical protein
LVEPVAVDAERIPPIATEVKRRYALFAMAWLVVFGAIFAWSALEYGLTAWKLLVLALVVAQAAEWLLGSFRAANAAASAGKYRWTIVRGMAIAVDDRGKQCRRATFRVNARQRDGLTKPRANAGS